jgi:hypothetical protein
VSAKSLLVLAGALFLRCSLAPLAGAQEEELHALERRVPHLDDARAQLDHARRLKRTLLEREGDDRAFWRALAVEAYRAVRAFHPEAPAVGAEAAFRAAELLRAAGDDEPALRELAEARRLGGGTPFAARALLESGHIHRRAGRSRPALDAYLAVAGDARATQQHRDDAWIWAGQVWQAEGRGDDARRAWMGVAEDGADPLDRILAFDLIASSWLAAGMANRRASANKPASTMGNSSRK